MNPSYFRINISKLAATNRFARWLLSPELEPPKEVSLMDSVTLACDESGQWRGASLYFYEKNGWTVFEDLSGHFTGVPAEHWMEFAQLNDFVLAGYNDAIGCAELIVISNGGIIREFLDDADDPEVGVNIGLYEASGIEPIENWTDVARFVDNDDLIFSDRGWLWVFKERRYELIAHDGDE